MCECPKINSYHFAQPSPVGQRGFRFDPRSVHGRFVLDRVAPRRVFSPNTSVFPRQYHCTISLYPYYQKDKRTKPGNLETNQCSVRYREAVRRVLPHLFQFFFTAVPCSILILSKYFIYQLMHSRVALKEY